MFKAKQAPSVKLDKLAQRSREERWSVYSLDDGLQSLPDALECKLKSSHVSISTADKCESIELNSNGVEINLKSGKNIKANRVISSIPAKELAKLLGEKHPQLVKMLSEHKNATVGIVNLRYKGNVLKKPAFGFLVPPSETVPLLGVVYDSTCFPHSSGDTVLTAMMGGHSFYPQFANSTPNDLYKIAVKNVARILDITQEPCESSVSILHNCIPQYTVGHYERNDEIFKYIKQNKLPIHLIGCSYNGISLNDVIMSAKLAASEISL
jgi:oxygen-dependent protoporphyrinogen oxidase